MIVELFNFSIAISKIRVITWFSLLTSVQWNSGIPTELIDLYLKCGVQKITTIL